MKVSFSTHRCEDSKAFRRFAVLYRNTHLAMFLVGILFLGLFSRPVNAKISPSLISASKLLMQGNLLPVCEVLEQSNMKIQRSNDWLSLITSTPIPQELRGHVSLNLSYARAQGYQGDKVSFGLFEEDESEYFVSTGLLKFLHAQKEPQFKQRNVSYETMSIGRNGIEIEVNSPAFLGASGRISLRYWTITHFQHTQFSGQVTIVDHETHLKGALSHWDHSLEAFRKVPYSGHGLAVSFDVYKELIPGTVVFVREFPLYARDILYNAGILKGTLESDRKYVDPEDFLNYGALIKGRYEYRNLRLPVTINFVYGIRHNISENIQVQLSANRSFRPELQISIRDRDWQITTRYRYPSLYYLEIGKNNISAGLYLGGTTRTGLTSVGLTLNGRLRF